MTKDAESAGYSATAAISAFILPFLLLAGVYTAIGVRLQHRAQRRLQVPPARPDSLH